MEARIRSSMSWPRAWAERLATLQPGGSSRRPPATRLPAESVTLASLSLRSLMDPTGSAVTAERSSTRCRRMLRFWELVSCGKSTSLTRMPTLATQTEGPPTAPPPSARNHLAEGPCSSQAPPDLRKEK